MVSPKIKREMQLFLYVFSAKFLKLWESPQILKSLYVNTDILGFKRFSFGTFLGSSHEFFSNLLIFEDQETNNCQFKKFHSRFLKILQNEYLANQLRFQKVKPEDLRVPNVIKDSSQQVFSSPPERSILESFYEFHLLALSIKAVFLEPKKFAKLLQLTKEKEGLISEVMRFFQLGENYFGIEPIDFLLIGNWLLFFNV
jgi:hypothetical protein